MTYTAQENAVDTARPYFLYKFIRRGLPVRLTSEPDEGGITKDVGDGDGSQVWAKSSISHGNLPLGSNIEKQNVDFTFGITDPIGIDFLTPAYGTKTTVTIWRGHHSDGDGELRVVWKGRVVVSKTAQQTIRVTCESAFTSMRRTSPNAKVQRPCRHALYFEGCNLDKADFQVAATISGVNATGLILTIDEAALSPSGEYKAGMIEWGSFLGFIQSHVGNQITLAFEVPGLKQEFDDNGDISILIYPGCNRTQARCNDRFNNTDNMGGHPDLNTKNPFTISIV